VMFSHSQTCHASSIRWLAVSCAGNTRAASGWGLRDGSCFVTSVGRACRCPYSDTSPKNSETIILL